MIFQTATRITTNRRKNQSNENNRAVQQSKEQLPGSCHSKVLFFNLYALREAPFKLYEKRTLRTGSVSHSLTRSIMELVQLSRT
jgi:hypothetical protein